jgi:hypothetical protein
MTYTDMLIWNYWLAFWRAVSAVTLIAHTMGLI